MEIVTKTDLSGLPLLRKGKVREVYDAGEHLLIVASDRISAFDVVMDEGIPGKGKILSGISEFWFQKAKHIIPNHFVTSDVSAYPEICRPYADLLRGRSMLIEKCTPLPFEFVVRGYLAGSGWKEYKQSGSVCGIELPAGLREYEKLPYPIFTPATKAEEGHDENISFDTMARGLGEEIAGKLRDISIRLYEYGAEYLESIGIIIADTKFEFGRNSAGDIILIDEALTPDSSRFWLAESYAPGVPQMNFDKQVLRDYLETLDWDKQYPPPTIPAEVIGKVLDKYKEAYKRIIGNDFRE